MEGYINDKCQCRLKKHGKSSAFVIKMFFLVMMAFSQTQATSVQGFLGCFTYSTVLESKEAVYIPGDISNLQPGSLTYEQLASSCSIACSLSYTPQKYALLSQMGICLCTSNSIEVSNAVASNLCDLKACNLTTDANECVSDTYYGVINTTQQLNGVTLTNSQTIHGLTVQNLTARTNPVNFPNTSFSFVFGDGYTSDFKPSDVYGYLYISPGYYSASVSAKTPTSVTPVTSLPNILHVVVPPNGIFFDAPAFFESNIDVNYLVLFREGTNMTVTVESPGSTIALPIADPSILAIGALFNDLFSSSLVASNPNVGTYIMPNTAFVRNGLISGFEVLVTKPGQLRLQIFRPICKSVSGPYCFASRQCTTSSCPTQNMLSNATSNPVFGSNAPADYKLISEVIFLANLTGYQYLKVKTNDMKITKGYVLGIRVSSTSGDITHKVSASATEYFYTTPSNALPGTNFLTTSSTKKTIQHIVRAHLSTTSVVKKTDRFTKAGIAILKGTATNTIGTFTDTKMVYIQDRIIDLKIATPKSYTVQAYPFNETLAMTTTKTKGSNISYAWLIVDGLGKNFTSNSTESLDYVPPNPGIYTLFVKGSNLINSENDTVVFEALEKIEKLTINSTNGRIISESGKKLNVTVTVIKGTNVTLTATFGSGPAKTHFIQSASPSANHIFQFDVPSCIKSQVTVTAQNRLPGTKTESVQVDIVCPITGLKVLATPVFTTVDGKRQLITQSKKTVELKVSIETGSFVNYQFQNGFDQKHQNKDHSTLVTPKGVIFYYTYNTESTYDAKIIVTNSLSREEFTFKVAVKDCASPVLTITGSPVESNPTYVTRGEDYTVHGTLSKTNCTITSVITYSATLYKIGNATYLDTTKLDDKNLKYTVPKNSYRAGKYKVAFTQITVGSKGPEIAKHHAYVVIKQSDLVASIESGSSRVIPQKKRDSPMANTTSYYDIILDGSYSYDPDSSNTALKYEWRCKGKDLPNIPVNQRSKLLCYSSDFILLSTTTPILKVNTSRFIPDKTYVFVLTVKEGVRQANYTQTLELISGNPPTVQFQCISNCDTKWNNQEKIILKGQCPNCFDIHNIIYNWELLDKDMKSVSGIDQNINSNVTLTGWHKESMVINPGILSANTEYSLKLSAYYKDSASKKTVIQLTKVTSILPKDGHCVLSPHAGFVAQTKFQVKCTGWTTIDLPIRYQFMTKSSSSSSSPSATSLSREDYPTWYTGSEPWNKANILPLGNANKNYTIEIIIRVYNLYGAFVELKPQIAKVAPIEASSGESEENAATKAIEESKPKTNDSASLSQWAASAASILNAEPVKTSPGTTEAPKTVEKVQELTSARTSIITTLSHSNIEDISNARIKQLGEALNSVSSETGQLSDQAQDLGSKFLVNIAEKFSSNDERNVGAENLEQTSMALFGTLSNFMDATTTATESYLSEYKNVDTDSGTPTVSPTQGMTTKGTPTRKAQIERKVEQTKSKVDSYVKTLDLVSERLLKNKVVGESSMVTKTKAFELALVKHNYDNLANASFNTGDPSLGVVLPDSAALKSGVRRNGSILFPQAQVSCQTTVMNKILQTWDIRNAKNSASSIQSLKLRSEDFDSLTVENLTSDITISVKNRAEKLNFTEIALEFPEEMTIVEQKITSPDVPLLVQFDSPDNSPSNLTVLIQIGEPPTKTEYDIRLDITNQGIALSKNKGNVTSNSTTGSSKGGTPVVRNSNIRVIDSKTIIMWDFKKFTYGNQQNVTVYFNFFYHGTIAAPVLIPNIYTFDVLEVARKRNYTMRTFSCSCLYWNDVENKWAGNGCKVDTTKTDFNITVCKCNHLTSFGGFFVKPNPIPPLTADMFLKGYISFVAVSVTFLLFIIGLVLARRSDKKDINKVGVCPLSDNKPDHNYLYQITVWTGMRRGAGTKSNVYFILSGDRGDTDIRHLKDPDRPTFQQSSSDVFVFSTEQALGDLSHIRIWHDNSGGGWYLRKIVVTDLQTDKTYQFLCNRWLAVEHEDGQVEMVAPVSGRDELKDFNYVFLTKTRNDLTDSHLWFSVYARPPRSPFTRVQRLVCCMSLLMTSMLASAMFYKRAPKPTPQTANYAAGLTFTWAQVSIAIMSTAITVPVNVIIVTLFRSSKQNDVTNITKVSPSRSASKASVADITSIKSSSTVSHSDSPDPNLQQNSQIPLLERNPRKESKSVKIKIDETEKKQEKKAKKSKKEPFLFPHWCIYIAWFFAFASIIASSVVVIMYGMAFGNSKSWDWLSSITVSFVSDILVIQPIKVLAIAVFFALIIRNIDDDQPQVEEEGKKLAKDEEWLHAHTDTSFGTAVDTMTLRPPDDMKLSAMRELKYKERKMGAISREILLYSFYVFVTLTISYSLREEQGYWQTLDIEELFQIKVRENTKPKYQFDKVLSYNEFWPWAENLLIPNLFPDPWYPNKNYPEKTREFPGKLYINDAYHKIVNGVRIRQVRVKHDSCEKNKDVKDVIKIDCNAPYGLTSEDQSSALGNWSTTIKNRPTITRDNQPWLYQTWSELDGYPFLAELTTYYGGGYTLDLFPRWDNIGNLRKLKEKKWIDRHTRAILIEFALFNPSTNHFSMVTMVFEFAATGGCIHYTSVHTFKLYRYTTGYAFFTIACEVVFLLLLLLYLYRELKEWYKLRSAYFTQFWNLMEVSINILSLVSIGFYFYREKLANDLLKRLPSKQPNVFINFQFAAYCDQVFLYIVSLIVFFVSIKFIKLLRFNRRMSILADTLKDAWYPLGMFSIVMGIVLLGSFAFGTIVFGTSMYGYRNLLVTASTQISLLLGKFNFYEYENTNRIIGPLFFLGYIIMVNWILMNMFVSIINDSYESVCKNLAMQSNDYEIVDFVMDRFKEWVGFGKTRKSKIEHNIRWDSAKTKINALRAFSAQSKSAKKSDNWRGDDDELGGLAHSVYWHFTPTFDGAVVDRELDIKDVNKTVDRFIDCINLLYFDDAKTAEKMSKKVKQEISNADYFDDERELKP